MKVGLLCISVLFSFFSFSQQLDKYQNETIVKRHRIKSRTIQFEGGTKSAIICDFDQDGRLMKWILTDNETGEIPQATIRYKYNSKAKPFSAIETFDQDSVTQYFEYAADGKLAKKISKFSKGNLKGQTAYLYSPYTEVTSLYWGDDEVYRKETSVYDEKGYSIKFSGFDLSDSTSQTWNYTFENEFDGSGNLVKKTTTSEGKEISIEEYNYDKAGLLRWITTIHTLVGGFKSKDKFSYTFY
jgi:hypothetical protein